MSSQTLGFQAEIKQLLSLVTNSLYSNREIFLRELISNASDAADKLRFIAIEHPELLKSDPDLKIVISFNKEQKTLTVSDNGIGMNREEVINNLGTIAKSGTKEFLSSLSKNQANQTTLIGQFGVGFYSAFVVSDKVEVLTRKAGEQQGIHWESEGTGEFTVKEIEKDGRGTTIILHLKNSDLDLLDYWHLNQMITKYSDHIMFPIMMTPPSTKEEPNPKPEMINKATALWLQPKKELTDEAYQAFYRHISHDYEDALTWSHNHVEGKIEYTSLIYIPKKAPLNFWTQERKHGLKLYVQRVFIMDNAEQLLPNYLRFVQGVVDTRDLPLNVSREILQNNQVIDQIRAGIVKRILEMIDKLSSEQFKIFYSNFGNALKEGIVEDMSNKERLADLLRFTSTKSDNHEPTVSFSDYLSRMLPEQDKIYYITAESYALAKNSPYLEVFNRNNIEVLLLTDRIDEWWLSYFTEYQGKSLQAITKGDIDLSKLTKEEPNSKLEETDDLKILLEKMKNILGDKISAINLSKRLTDSPVCLVTNQNDLSFSMQKMMQSLGRDLPKTKPILEINPEHNLIKKLVMIKDNENALKDWTELLFEQGSLIAGNEIEDIIGFTKRLNRLLEQNS